MVLPLDRLFSDFIINSVVTADVSRNSSQYRDSERDEMRRQRKIRQMTASFLHSGPSSQGVKCSIIGDVVNKLLAAHNNSAPRSSKVTLVIRVGSIIHHRHWPGKRATIMVSTPGPAQPDCLGDRHSHTWLESAVPGTPYQVNHRHYRQSRQDDNRQLN